MYYNIYSSSEENYMYYDYNKQTNNTKKDTTCIICWTNESEPILLKQITQFITFCDCNTYIHDDCLNTWYCKTYSCPICRAYIIYDPHFTNRVRIQRKFVGFVSYCYNIVKQITNIICVFVAWNIALNILCNIYFEFYPIELMK
jgi:hypothetical protein